MAQIEIKTGEVGVTRVFSLSMDAAAAKRLRDDATVQTKALGTTPQNPSGIQVFPVSDLGELGLAGFLREGVDADAQDIARDQAKLAALDGWVLLVHSSAFSAEGAMVKPAAALTLIGTYGQTPAPKSTTKLEADSAAAYSGQATGGPPEITRSRGSAGWVVVALAIVAIGILLWAFA